MYLPNIRQTLITAAVFLALIFATAALAGCATRTDPPDADFISEHDVKLQDGRTIHCIFYTRSRSRNGMDCDWANAK